ncbi:integrase core domain-containing protein [Pseudoclavibacter sp. CFCC 11306]|uniref:integrase core domain-containing protein n=1 Tax=Pseudoclavibacter sp. CFCC 11306 TaxID=1564493 RepID=UPI00130114F2|nr:integrase core domain-containing protein [Pseudoclavibacter sp. CFCC 11306]KAB1658878.1 DDE-type integrase/transposase/recombinase [Pseudoclavibacter sp. CFCC 11306]
MTFDEVAELPARLVRDLSTDEPSHRCIGDIPYRPIAGRTNLYLATCIELGSCKVAGRQIVDHLCTRLVEEALTAAACDRGSLAGAVFHNNHGPVYTAKAYTDLCKHLGIAQSMGSVRSSADNSLAESFNATLKRELLEDTTTFPDQAIAHRALFAWANRYNTRRRHSAIGLVSPNTYETTHTATASATVTAAA